jgi:hypothetical protein
MSKRNYGSSMISVNLDESIRTTQVMAPPPEEVPEVPVVQISEEKKEYNPFKMEADIKNLQDMALAISRQGRQRK